MGEWPPNSMGFFKQVPLVTMSFSSSAPAAHPAVHRQAATFEIELQATMSTVKHGMVVVDDDQLST